MEKGYNSKLNFCSYSPDSLFGVNFNYGCYLHDRHYRNERIDRLTRKKADELLRDKIYSTYAKKNKKFLGFLISRIYYITVRLFGGFAWEK